MGDELPVQAEQVEREVKAPARKSTPPSGARVVALQIAEQLQEQELAPQITLYRIVKTVGEAVALDLLRQTQAIEAAGGMMLPDASRRRTPGGVYFTLVRRLVTREEYRRIFYPGQPKQAPTAQTTETPSPKQRKRKTREPLPPDAWTWSERGAILDQADTQRGEARTVKCTIIGRPEQLVEQGQCVTFTLQQAPKIPSLPAGLPLPSLEEVAATSYAVYIARKQWKKVAEAIKNPEDVLIVEGFQMLDQAHGKIAVFASNVTTKLLQSAGRQAKSEQAG